MAVHRSHFTGGEAKARTKQSGGIAISCVTLGERINLLILSFLGCKMGIKSIGLGVVEKTVYKLSTEHLARTWAESNPSKWWIKKAQRGDQGRVAWVRGVTMSRRLQVPWREALGKGCMRMAPWQSHRTRESGCLELSFCYSAAGCCGPTGHGAKTDDPLRSPSSQSQEGADVNRVLVFRNVTPLAKEGSSRRVYSEESHHLTRSRQGGFPASPGVPIPAWEWRLKEWEWHVGCRV